jgi:hypothetical protein
MPNENDIVVNEGDSLKVQCMTEGNPKPTITWSKKVNLFIIQSRRSPGFDRLFI